MASIVAVSRTAPGGRPTPSSVLALANVAKYLDGQIVIGVNPDPTRLPELRLRAE